MLYLLRRMQMDTTTDLEFRLIRIGEDSEMKMMWIQVILNDSCAKCSHN